MTPLVSILIPAFNAEEWISDTIRSALGQTWERKEIIVVDDGSSDGTLTAARRFEREGVRVASQKNQGAAVARNTAFALSRGDYVQWLDADDLLAPDKISWQMAAVGPGAGAMTLLSCPWGHFLYRPYRAMFIPSSLWADLSPAEFLLRKLERRVFMQTAVWLVSRELTEAAGPWNTSMVYDDDGEYFSRVLLASDGIRFVREAKVYYRMVGSASLSYLGRSERKAEALWASMQLHMKYLRSLDDSTATRAACLQYLQNYLGAFYPSRAGIVAAMHAAAAELGGGLEPPSLSWKYSWIRDMVGWRWAKRAQLVLPQVKWACIRRWDKMAWRMDTRRLKGSLGI